MEMFATADRRAVKNEVTEKAVLDVQSLSELYSGTGDMKSTAEQIFGEDSVFFIDENVCTVYLDRKADPLYVDEVGRAVVRLLMNEQTEQRESGRYSELTILMQYPYEINIPFYKQTCAAYIPSDGKEGSQ